MFILQPYSRDEAEVSAGWEVVPFFKVNPMPFPKTGEWYGESLTDIRAETLSDKLQLNIHLQSYQNRRHCSQEFTYLIYSPLPSILGPTQWFHWWCQLCITAGSSRVPQVGYATVARIAGMVRSKDRNLRNVELNWYTMSELNVAAWTLKAAWMNCDVQTVTFWSGSGQIHRKSLCVCDWMWATPTFHC